MQKYDKNLIFLYCENANQKLRDAASLLHKSPQRLKYSLSLLEKEQVLHNSHCIFDYSYFGLILFRVYFRGGYVGERDKASIIKKLSDNPYIVSIYELSGEFDLAIEVVSPNPSRFNKELKKVANIIPTLNNYKMILNLVTYLYPRSYLTKTLSPLVPQEIIIGGDRDILTFNQKELLLIKTILSEPKIRQTKLAKKADINVKTAVTVIKDLTKRQIIRGFKYILNAEKLELYRYRLFLKLHSLSPEEDKKLLEFMLKTKEIVQVNKTVGDWEMEIDLESPDKAKIRKIIIELREEFKGMIENFNSMEFYQYYKKSYLPQYLFADAQPQTI